MAGRIVAWSVGALIALLYVYLVVAAIGNLIGLGNMAALLGLELTPAGWLWLSFGIALPVVVFAVALIIGRRRRAGSRLIVLAAGLALVAAVQLEVLILVPQTSFFA